jgi:nucleotide-binding universal stress UspA family protein
VSKIIVGVDGSDRSDDAFAFASSFARRTAAEIVLARAYPYDDEAGHLADSSRRHHLREDAQETLDRLRALADVSLEITTRTIADPSPSRALHTLAEREGAALVVIGSSHRGGLGRVFAGTTAERLLHGAPCPVAVAPRGMAAHGTSIDRIAVGWDRSAEATAALTAAVAIARAVGAGLRVVEVLDIQWAGTPAIIPGSGAELAAHQPAARARRSLDELIAGLPDDVHMESAVVLGHPVGDLVRQSEDADLLVLGSRGYGPRRAVLLGGVSGRVVRRAACPVIVVPRGHETPLEDLFRPASLAEAAARTS